MPATQSTRPSGQAGRGAQGGGTLPHVAVALAKKSLMYPATASCRMAVLGQLTQQATGPSYTAKQSATLAHERLLPAPASGVAGGAELQLAASHAINNRGVHGRTRSVYTRRGARHMQAPDTQVCPIAHAVPHALQLAASACVFVQVLPHNVVPAGQALQLEPPQLWRAS
jgi:hypothetical protein